jgi:hypothetical protein
MSDIEGKMAEWRKTVWGAGPCPVPSQENFTLTDDEREAVEWFAKFGHSDDGGRTATLRGLLERIGGAR